MSRFGSRNLVCLLPLVLWLAGGCLPAPHGRMDEEKDPHFISGKNRVSAMDYAGAIDSFQKALEANPQSSSAHFELGWLYDQKETDPAAAIYHYGRYLALRGEAENAEMVKTRIMACKQELARTVSLGPITQNWQKEFDQLAEENKRLREELERWRGYAAQLQAQTSHVAQVNLSAPPQPGNTRQAPPVGNPGTSARTTTSGRSHTVRAGETMTIISRKYGVRTDSLQSANPRVDPRRLKVGQVLSIPPG
jgi:LysM repeat protein